MGKRLSKLLEAIKEHVENMLLPAAPVPVRVPVRAQRARRKRR